MSNVAKPIDKPWRWKTGESGNPAGRPKGSRNAFSLAFVGDLTAAWAQHGPDILQKVALTDPSRFLGVCASVLPRDVALTIEQQHPGGLSPDDWQLACSVFEAVKTALPNANDRQPSEVLNYVLDAIRGHSAKMIESE